MRRIIKRFLKKYDYPPDKAKKALETVLRQTELMCGSVDFNDVEWKIAPETDGQYK
ncbi:type I restriction enzyme endonuclease domain-containing protein [Clostridium hominis]|uniref:type I restriction enzyme endonuclease domain-containing protein n=1 Tax=Clostridium hominis TaxID=2763036 RepID=UPI001A9A9730|nr:type I restriction enzyme endonuclease domain-containing protein [Clostridium hominis]